MSEVPEELEPLRSEVDRIDDQIVDAYAQLAQVVSGLLSERELVVDQISEVKKAHGIPIVQRSRQKNVIERTNTRAIQTGADPVLVKKLFEDIHSKSVLRQMKDRGVISKDE